MKAILIYVNVLKGHIGGLWLADCTQAVVGGWDGRASEWLGGKRGLVLVMTCHRETRVVI
jgi:hypothetical protein